VNVGEVPQVSQVVRFVGWLGDGRKLTQTGRLRLADARELVTLLGTGDRLDPEIGERVFRTKSSDELRELATIVEWAKASRLVRVAAGRLVPVKKNAALVSRPDDLWTRMFEVFGQLGLTLCPAGWFASILRLTFDESIDQTLRLLVSREKGVVFDEIGDLAWRIALARYVIDGTPEQLKHARAANDRDLRTALDWLSRFGALDTDDDRYTLTRLGHSATRRLLGAPRPGLPVLRLRVTLNGSEDPEIWRRILVPAAIPLDRLHETLQAAMGWQNHHLHEFSAGTGPDGRPAALYGLPDAELPHVDERRFTLEGVVAAFGDRLGYTYDFGDGWEHDIVVELHTTAKDGEDYPGCLAGAGACPPEDCGGIGGYQHLRQVLADQDCDEHEDMLRWLGLTTAADFNPTFLDLAQVNARLAAVSLRPTT
jgi:hypothetical protein